MNFASDNTAPAHPKVVEALIGANEGYALPYGRDPMAAEAEARVREVFEAPDAAVFPVATGTAANALSLSALCPPWGAVLCHETAHVYVDECGAPEFYTGGAKLVAVPGAHGRIDPDALESAIAGLSSGDVHSVAPMAVSLTNTTECGTVHAPEAVAAVAAVAHRHGLALHMDGARLANALASSGASPAEMTWRAGVDVLSLGGTKNGLFAAEAVVAFDPALARELAMRRMRGGHLFSKHRFLAAQMLAYLDDGLWLRLAAAANAAAARLARGLGEAGAKLTHPTEANQVFAAFPRAAHRRLRAAGADYYILPHGQSLDGDPGAPLAARMVCSWCTADRDITRFCDLVAG